MDCARPCTTAMSTGSTEANAASTADAANLAQDGPRVVALGGGHGTAATLRAVRRYAGEVTAIVSVADDGGSSGRLRQALGIPAPGDLRRCLVALAENDSVWADTFEHRFAAGELKGHAVGNLIIAGLASATGNFIDALVEAGRLLGSAGRVLPATRDAVVLTAQAAGGSVQGQVAVEKAGPLSCVSLAPPDPAAPEEALDAILAADQVVIGPGSLFTSVLAVLAVPDIRLALAKTAAAKVYVCNLRTAADTDGFDVAAHVGTVVAHGVHPDVVLYDPGTMKPGSLDTPAVAAPLGRPPDHLLHDPARLAAALARLAGLTGVRDLTGLTGEETVVDTG